MTDTTYEEAVRCPKCEEKGKYISESRGPHGSKIHRIMCMNNRCKWSGTTYIVQVHANGTVQPPVTDRDKSFPTIPDRTDAVQGQLNTLYNQSLRGEEIR